MQIRKPDGVAHAIEFCRGVELAHRFAFDPASGRGEKAHLSFSQGVHVSFCARQSGIGFEWFPKLVSHQRLLLFREALICLSYSGMNVVVPAGNAPASSGYQPGALLLSYETMVNCGFTPKRFTGRNTRFNRCVGPNSQRTIWFIAPTEEQFALITDCGSH